MAARHTADRVTQLTSSLPLLTIASASAATAAAASTPSV